MFRFPWGDMHSLNLGWFLQKFNELREDWATAEAGIDAEIEKAEDALSDVFAARDAAAASATAAAGSASAAGTSATAAQNSATGAASSATLANQKATAAGLSEAAAAQSAQQAGNSATAAAGSATSAGQSATNAAASETAAGNSATAAAGSATAAGNSATAAAGSASDAADAAASVEAATQQIANNTSDIADLQESLQPLTNNFEEIETITLSEDSTYVLRTQTPQGTPYNFSGCIIKIKLPERINPTTWQIFYRACVSDNITADFCNAIRPVAVSASTSFDEIWLFIEVNGGRLFEDCEIGIDANPLGGIAKDTRRLGYYALNVINHLRLYGATLPAGTIITILGKWKS